GDFGISRSVTTDLRDTRLTSDGQFLGTPSYAAPEQIRGEQSDARSDLYALGATLYALLEGRPPFVGKTWGEVLSRVATDIPKPPCAGGKAPVELQRVVLQLLEKNPERRPSSYGSLRADLRALSVRALPAAGPGRRIAAGLVDTALSAFGIVPLVL